ncbi:alkaline phosphatase [Polycladidibacter stylochi]|uniref:alkaline phosphatase n=1 Tax=Polycladidibacter stylochi TaxID=1807766 RepID=UPI0008347EB3|nr:alkaline phosphatase [Pseudovibrio stylochi]
MKRVVQALLMASVCSTAAFAGENLPQANSSWYKDAQKELQQKLARTPNTNRAKNVIILIADGNGVGTNYATRIWQGQQEGKLGEEHVLSYEKFPYIALSKTYNSNAQTPDSAGTGTAMQTGIKTKAGVIGVDESVNRGDCAAVTKGSVATIGELLAAEGKSIGFVSTARITHATPASGYAHSADRNFEDNSKLPEGCAQKDIADQLIEQMKAGVVDLAMGGGRRHFLPKDVKGEEGKGGKRTDGRNLIEEAKSAGISYVWNDETLGAVDLKKGPVLGLFESSHMKYEYDRTGEPSLAEMVEASINALKDNENGFFLQVEAGRVDHANHAGNLYRVLTDGVAFADAVAKAAEMTSAEDTLIIVTADHEHAIAFNGYCGRGTPIHGLCYDIDPKGTKHTDKLKTFKDGKPYTVVGYLNGPGSVMREDKDWTGTRAELTQEQAIDPDFLQQSLNPSSSETHSGEDVAIYARGPWAHLVDGTVEQNYIFHVMHYAATGK